MSIFINHIVEKIDISVYENVFSQHGPVYFGIYDKTKKFIDNKFLNFKASLPSYIEKNEIIDYAENYDQDIEEIYLQLKKEFFDRYCYFLSRSNQNFVGGVYDYLYFFRIHIKAASRFLDENNIQYLFIAPASLGFDNILYEVAKIKKKKQYVFIKVIIIVFFGC
jgi:AAA+ ATPase superfamily predicted ATPase